MSTTELKILPNTNSGENLNVLYGDAKVELSKRIVGTEGEIPEKQDFLFGNASNQVFGDGKGMAGLVYSVLGNLSEAYKGIQNFFGRKQYDPAKNAARLFSRWRGMDWGTACVLEVPEIEGKQRQVSLLEGNVPSWGEMKKVANAQVEAYFKANPGAGNIDPEVARNTKFKEIVDEMYINTCLARFREAELFGIKQNGPMEHKFEFLDIPLAAGEHGWSKGYPDGTTELDRLERLGTLYGKAVSIYNQHFRLNVGVKPNLIAWTPQGGETNRKEQTYATAAMCAQVFQYADYERFNVNGSLNSVVRAKAELQAYVDQGSWTTHQKDVVKALALNELNDFRSFQEMIKNACKETGFLKKFHDKGRSINMKGSFATMMGQLSKAFMIEQARQNPQAINLIQHQLHKHYFAADQGASKLPIQTFFLRLQGAINRVNAVVEAATAAVGAGTGVSAGAHAIAGAAPAVVLAADVTGPGAGAPSAPIAGGEEAKTNG